MRIAVVFNPVKVDERTLRNALYVEVPAEELDASFIETDAADHGVAASDAALAFEPELVLVAGGDGTVRMVADRLAGTGTPLGIIPSGTGNLLARNLHLPIMSMRDAVHVAVHGSEVVIDLASATATSPDGEQSEHPFAVMAGIGLDAATMSATDSELKKRIGWVAYVGGLFKALQEVRQFTATGTLDDDQEKSFEANTVLIGNAGMLQGNVRMMPDAELDDGLLDIAIVNPGGALEWMQVMNEVVSISDPIQRELRKLDILPDRKKIRTLGFRQTSRIRLQLDEPVELQVDGDLIGEIVALDCRVRPDALTVKVKKRD